MITILGNGLVYWTGILAGIFMTFSFFGCVCNFKYFINSSFMKYFRARHVLFMRVAFSFFVVHALLALLGKYFGIYI